MGFTAAVLRAYPLSSSSPSSLQTLSAFLSSANSKQGMAPKPARPFAIKARPQLARMAVDSLTFLKMFPWPGELVQSRRMISGLALHMGKEQHSILSIQYLVLCIERLIYALDDQDEYHDLFYTCSSYPYLAKKSSRLVYLTVRGELTLADDVETSNSMAHGVSIYPRRSPRCPRMAASQVASPRLSSNICQ
jgi:hypothetical protein